MSELAKALAGNSAAASPTQVLEALDEVLAHRSFPHVPHTIYQEVWHLAFWQRISLDWVCGNARLYPMHAGLGFPPPDEMERHSWAEVKEQFLAGTVEAAAASERPDASITMIQCPTSHGRPVRVMSIQDQLISLAAHNHYHLGRIVLLRQMAQAWPPPSGGDTW